LPFAPGIGMANLQVQQWNTFHWWPDLKPWGLGIYRPRFFFIERNLREQLEKNTSTAKAFSLECEYHGCTALRGKHHTFYLLDAMELTYTCVGKHRCSVLVRRTDSLK
jgi:hypothetical protein